MHTWSDENVDWDGINEAAFEIGEFIAKWGRIHVSQTKEKYGTVRVYCSLGFDTFHSLVFPWHHWVHNWWPYRFDLWLGFKIQRFINWLILPYQKWVYRLAYKKAVKKRPHLRDEILIDADWYEYLDGIAGFNYKEYYSES